MNTKLLKQVATSNHPFFRFFTNTLRRAIKAPLYKLLNFRKGDLLPQLIGQIERERGFMMWPDEMAMLYMTASKMAGLQGDFAELGVATGGSAKLLCAVKGDKPLHLFDTFEGLPDPSEHDINFRGQYACSVKDVQQYLYPGQGVYYHVGTFPESIDAEAEATYSFVHLDVDLYPSTLEGLKFFYPRMVTGGAIISHDYSTLPGVKKAVDEFFADKVESVIELPTSQCLVIKV